MTTGTTWNTQSLFDALSGLESVKSGQLQLVIVEGEEPTIKATLTEYGDMQLFIVAAGEQVIVESLLFVEAELTDAAKFNEAVLRSRDIFPLSSIALESLPDGENAYTMYGALSSSSPLETIVTEINTLAENIGRAVDAFGEYLN